LPLLHVKDCQRINVNGCQLIGGGTTCLQVESSREVLVAASAIYAGGGVGLAWTGKGERNLVTGCRIAQGPHGEFVEADSGVKFDGNLSTN
jgi:hypothetical protein